MLKGGEPAAPGAGDPDPIAPPARPPAPKRMVRADVCADQATAIMEFLTSASLSCSLSTSSDLSVAYFRSHSSAYEPEAWHMGRHALALGQRPGIQEERRLDVGHVQVEDRAQVGYHVVLGRVQVQAV